MPRRKIYPDKCQASFRPGTFKRIEAVLDRDVDDRTDFIREAVDALLDKREKALRGRK